MKKCPKCHGHGIIKNYTMIDGGICYECNGKKFVSDDHKLYQKPKAYSTPEWVKQKEYAVMKNYQEMEKIIIEKIAGILEVKKGYAREVLELMDGDDKKALMSMKDNELFTKTVIEFYNANKADIC